MKLILLTLFLCGLSFGFSQSIKGTITDKANQPQPFTNVIIYEEGGNDSLTGAVSDSDGYYEFNNLKKSKYSLEVSSLGFKTEKIEVFEFVTELKIFNFTLHEEEQVLGEVVIKSKRTVIK
jgi:hypothetical protein